VSWLGVRGHPLAQAGRQPAFEWTSAQWAFGEIYALSAGLRIPTVRHAGVDVFGMPAWKCCGGVFRCSRCKGFVGWCMGGGNDRLCDRCWLKSQRRVRVARKRGRR